MLKEIHTTFTPPPKPIEERLVESENALNAALHEYEAATRAFMKCRAYSNKVYADLCCQSLFEASRRHADLLRENAAHSLSVVPVGG